MTKQLKLAVCERPFVKGVTQALIPEGSGYDLVREAAFAMDIYILEDTFCEVELYINFTNNKVIQMVENDCKNKGISLTKMYRGLDGEYHKGWKSECLYFALFLFVFGKQYIILEKIPYYKRKIKKFIYKKFIYDQKNTKSKLLKHHRFYLK